MTPHGLTVPIDGVCLADHGAILDAADAAGFTDLWSSEVNASDAFTPLVRAAVTHPQFRLGTAIVPAFTRSPALLAMSAAALADLQPAGVVLGIGASSNVIVEQWNGVPFERPYQRVRDVAMFLRRAFTQDKVDMECESFTISGFRLGVRPAVMPKVLIAGLRPGMLHLAGREADGAILNWLSPDDVATVVPFVDEGRDTPAEIVARLFVMPSTDIDAVRAQAKRLIAAYLNVPVYAAFHRFLGRARALEPMWSAWAAGERRAALATIPDSLVDELFIHGTPAQCLARIDDYVAAGVTTPVIALHAVDDRPVTEVIASLGVSRG